MLFKSLNNFFFRYLNTYLIFICTYLTVMNKEAITDAEINESFEDDLIKRKIMKWIILISKSQCGSVMLSVRTTFISTNGSK